MINAILQIVKIDPELVEAIKPSFDTLPHTDHADGHFRLRKYSRIKAEVHRGSWFVESLNMQTFNQSRKYNKHQGGMSRSFNPIDDDVIHSTAMRELLTAFYEACHLPDLHEVDVHQMRVKCTGGATQLSPEGWHQDGYDCIAMIGISRHNVFGGEILLSTGKTETPFLQAELDSGTMVIVDDGHLWHNGRAIQPVDDDKGAHMDMLVFTAKR
jgi:hypothetical protein